MSSREKIKPGSEMEFYLFAFNFIAPGTSGFGLIPKKAQCVSLRFSSGWEKVLNKWGIL